MVHLKYLFGKLQYKSQMYVIPAKNQYNAQYYCLTVIIWEKKKTFNQSRILVYKTKF